MKSFKIDQAIMETLLPGCWEEVSRTCHRLLPARRDVLEMVFQVVGASGGVWGEPPPYLPDGSVYLEPADSRIIADFKLWAHPLNQSMLPSLGVNEKMTGFTMVVDAETSEELLESIYEAETEDRGHFSYPDFIRHVPKWVEDLGWIYVPLAGEYDLGLSLVAKSRIHLLTKLDPMLTKAAITSATLSVRDGKPSLTQHT